MVPTLMSVAELLCMRGVDVKLSDRLDKNTRNKLKNLSSKSKRKPDKLSDKDLADLMGIHRDRYERKGGSVRRK